MFIAFVQPGKVVVFTSEVERFKIGNKITMAECGGISPDPNDRFTVACNCGRDCSSGSHPIVVGIRNLPGAWEEVREVELDAMRRFKDATKKRQTIEAEARNNALTDVKIKVTCLMTGVLDSDLYHSELIGAYGQDIAISHWRSRGESGKDIVIQQAREAAIQNGYIVVGETIIEVI